MVTSAVYTPAVLSTAKQLVAERRLRPRFLVDACHTRLIEAAELRDVDPELDSLRDCDTPEAYEDLLERAGLLRGAV